MTPIRRHVATIACWATLSAGCGTPTSASPSPAAAGEPAATIAEALALRADATRYEDSLATLAASEDATTARRARYLLARHHADQGRVDDAITLFSRTVDEAELLAPWALVDLALAAESAGKLDVAIAAATRAAGGPATSAAPPEAKIHLVRLLAKGDTVSLDGATAAVMALRIDEQTEPLLVELADALDALKRHDLALRIRTRLLNDYPQGRFTERTFANVKRPPGSLPSPFAAMSTADLDALAEKLARRNRLDQALDLLAIAEKKAPSASRRDDSAAIRARILFRARKYADVTAIQPSLTSTHYAEVQHLRALAFWRTGRNEQFLAVADRLAKTRPNAKESLDARVLVAKYYAIDEKDHVKAAKLMKAAVDRGAAGSDGENLWLAAWYEIVAGRNDDALATIDSYLRQYPNHDYTANALFWKGRLLDARGSEEARDAAFTQLERVRPYDYFTWRARELGYLAKDPSSSIESGFSFPEIRPVETMTDVRVRRALELESVGLIDRAVLEWRLAQADSKGDPSLSLGLADLYARAGQTSRSMRIILGDFRDIVRHGAPNVPQRFWELLYPRAHWDLITREAARHDVDPWLVSAIIRQESAFEPTIVSSAGAVGLMQIMPKDAPRMAKNAGISQAIRRADLFDVETSIRLGTYELANKRQIMDGNEILAIAAYNAGESAVKKWIADTPIDDIDRFIESIPYPETRLYVKIVLKNRNEYRRVYGE